MELGTEIGTRAEPHRDRYEFFEALYGKLACNDRNDGTTVSSRGRA